MAKDAVDNEHSLLLCIGTRNKCVHDHFLPALSSACAHGKLEGASQSTYLRQVNFYTFYPGSRDPGHALFEKFLSDHVRTVPGNMLVKFEVCSFNHFGAISI